MDVIHAIEGALNISPLATAWVTPVLLGSACLLSVGGLILFSGMFLGKRPKQQEESAQLAG